MSKAMPKTTARGSRRKAELLAASAELFQQRGYHNVSMDDIAAAVGITGPGLYRHFPNKHAVLVQALDAQVTSIESVAERVLAEEPVAKARFDTFLDELAVLVLDVHQVLLWKRERAHLNLDEQELVRLRLRGITDLTKQIIQGWRPELSDADARLLSWVLQSLFSHSEEYRSGMVRADLAQLLGRMARAAMSVDLSSAPQVEAHIRPGFKFVPVGRRERVLDAAATLFNQRGFRAVSVEDIADASQTALATVYQLVSSKASLLHAVLSRGSEGAIYMTQHRLAFAPDGETQLDTFVNTYIELAAGPHVRVLKILAADSVYLDEEAAHTLRRSQREYVEDWSRALNDVRPELPIAEARALVLTSIGVINETVQIASIRRRPNLQGEMRQLASAILNS